MTVRASKFPSVQIENSQWERQEWAEQNKEMLERVRDEERRENLCQILTSFAKNVDIPKYLERREKHKQKYGK